MSEKPEVWIAPDVVVTTGSTFDNAENLPQALLDQFRELWDGTNIGRQELYGEVLDDIAGALWSRALIEKFRVKKYPAMRRIVVAIDPMVADIAIKAMDAQTAHKPGGSETGIVAAGMGIDGHAYVLEDASLTASPLGWANRSIATLQKWNGDRLIGEKNNGGALIEQTLRSISANFPYKAVDASRGKITRAEPIAALYEQGKVHHVGLFTELEDQLVTFTGDPSEKSPDRLDALVWALTELMLAGKVIPHVAAGNVETLNYWSGQEAANG